MTPSRLCASLIIPICLALALGQARADDSVIKTTANGSFEDWTTAGPKGWQLNTHPDLAGTWEQSSAARTGQKGVLLRPGAKGQCHAYQWHFPVGPQMIFRATVWVKGQGQGGLQLYTYDAKQVFNGGWPGAQLTLSDQYQPVSFCYVPDRPEVSFVALVLVSAGKDGHAIFDDVTVESLDVADLARTSGHTADLAQEVKAGRWTATGGGSVEIGDGPYTAPGLRCRFAPAKAPEKAFDIKTWWRPSGGAVGGDASWQEADGPQFPLRSGIPYEARFRHSGQDGVSVHYKLRYFDGKGAEVKLPGKVWAYHQIGDTRTGSWPWRERSCVVVPPPDAAAGRIEVWALPGSGPVSLADLSVRVIARSGSAEDASPGVTASDKLVRDARPAPAPPAAVSRAAVAVKVPPPGRTRTVAATRTALRVELGTGVTLNGAFEGDNFLGIGEVRLGNLVLHAAAAPPWAPLLRGDPAPEYDRCELVAVEPGAAGHPDGVTLKLRLVAADGSTDELDWRLWPQKAKLVDVDAVGLGYSYAASTTRRTLTGVADRTVWGLAGTARGLTVQTQQSSALENVFQLSIAGGSAGGGGMRFVHADPFDFQTSPEGSLITYFERPALIAESPSAAPWGVRVWDEIRLPAGPRVETDPKYVVFTTARGPDAWAAARDAVYALCRSAYGIRNDTPLPLVNCSRLHYDVKPETKSELQRIAKEWVPDFQKLGFRRIYLGPLWTGIVCGPDRLEIGERYGGEEALKCLCDAAHQANIQVIEWLAPAHLWCESSLFKAHPEYELKGLNGNPPTSYCWPSLRGVNLTTPHWQYFVDSVRGIRERTGLDGLWLDSYCSFTHHVTIDSQLQLRQADALFRLHAAVQKLGMVTYVEGCACYGIKSNGLPAEMDDPDNPVFPDPATFYDSSPYFGPWYESAEKIMATYLGSGDHYYRYLANKCCPFIYYDAVLKIPGALGRIGQANRDYNAVVPFMERRLLLREDRGVQWNCQGKPKVLFAFQDFSFSAPGLRGAKDVTTGRPAGLQRGALPARQGHTYLLEVAGRP